MSDEARDLRGVGEQIEELLGRIRSAGDPGTAETAEEVVRLVVELYGAGLERTVALAGPEILERLVEDELVGIDPDGVVHLRLEGSCDGCPSSTQTVKLAIERAIEEAAPEVTAVEVENLTREREPQLLQIQPLYTECAVPAAAAAGTETRR